MQDPPTTIPLDRPLDRLLHASRWPLALLLLSAPVLLLLAICSPFAEALFEGGIVVGIWGVAALGLVFRVPAARGLAIGLFGLCAVGYALASDFSAPDNMAEAVVLAQALGLVLLLPAFGRVFNDSWRVRWTGAVVGVGVPAAAVFALDPRSASTFGYAALACIAVAVVGLLRQRTWALFALLAAAGALGLAAGLTHEIASPFPRVRPVAFVAATALTASCLPWLVPIARKLRAPE